MSRESIRLPKTMLGLVTGRSSFSRMGLEVQLTQDLRQPWHTGQLMLQLKNNAPFSFRVYPGMRIAQMVLGKLDGPCETGYDDAATSKYKGERGGISAQWFLDSELKNREIISRQTYLKPLLDGLLIAAGLFAVVVALGIGGAELSQPLRWTLIAVTAVAALLRFALYVIR